VRLVLTYGVAINGEQPSIPHENEGEMIMRGLKWILLGIYLIISGLILLHVTIGGNIMTLIAGICAVIAGILFLIDRG
jgi:hypothetical protein